MDDLYNALVIEKNEIADDMVNAIMEDSDKLEDWAERVTAKIGSKGNLSEEAREDILSMLKARLNAHHAKEGSLIHNFYVLRWSGILKNVENLDAAVS